MDALLEKDLIYRANSLYDNFQDLIKNFFPEKWYDSSLDFAIKDCKEINGKSWCNQDKDHIEINRGVLELFYNYFAKVMEYDKINFLRHLNISEDEDELRKISFEGVFYNGEKVELYDSKLVDDGKTKLLEIFVSRFIILHELGHLLNGHCKWMADNIKLKEMGYIPLFYYGMEKTLDEETALDIRTLEMDADAFAVTNSMHHVLFLYNNFEEQVRVRIEQPEIYYWWAFAIRSHFLTCEDLFMDNCYYKKMTHLPSNARWTLIYWAAIEIIDYYDITEQEKKMFKNMISMGAIDAERKFNCIKGSNYNWFAEVENNSQYSKYRNEVNKNWENLRNQLQEYTRLPLFGETTEKNDYFIK